MTSHSTGPFDPIAEAPGPAEPQEQRGPQEQTGPPGGPFSGPRSVWRTAADAGPQGMPPPGPPAGAFTGPPSTPFTGPPSMPPAGAFTGPPSGPLPGPPSGPLRDAYTGPPSGPIGAAYTGPPSGPVGSAYTGPPSVPFAGPPSGPLPVAAEAHHEPGRPGGEYRAKARAHDQAMPAAQAVDDDQLWAMMAYLGMIFFAFLPPLAVYLLRRRESRYVRLHAAQALNLWITTFLYTLSFMIIGGILALDTVSTALAVGIPLIVMAGIVMLLFAVRAAVAAGRGALYEIPGWICVPMVT